MTDPAAPARWLIAEYEATDLTGIPLPGDTEDPSGEAIARTWRVRDSVTIQPIFTLKGLMESCEPMTVTTADYWDPGRWWL